jgi:nucleoside-diphosphate-sugar epimerase
MIQTGHEVDLVDIRYTSNTDGLQCPKILGDVCDETTFRKVRTRPDMIFHAAAVSRVEWGETQPQRCLQVNVLGILNVAKWVLELNPRAHIIFASSREVYGEPVTLPVTEDHPRQPVSVYGISKLSAEQLLSHYGEVDGLRHTIIRLSNVYGSPRDLPERVIPRLITQALKGDALTLYGGDQVLDFTFIDDVIDGIAGLIKHAESEDQAILNNNINFATSVGHSIRELAHLAKAIVKSNSEVKITSRRSYDVRRFVGDYSKAMRLIGYTPKVSLEDGLRKYVERIMEAKAPTRESSEQ